MDEKLHEDKQKNSREGASLLSTLTFWYTLPIFQLGYKRDLNVNDLYEPLKEHSSHQLGDQIALLWEDECQRVKRKNDLNRKREFKHNYEPSLVRVLLRCFGFKFLWYGICLALMEILLKLSQPMLLAELLKYFTKDTKMTNQEAYMYASLIIFSVALYIILIHSFLISTLHLGMKMRVACCSLIYRKSLKLSRTNLGAATIGQAVNLMSNDVSRFDTGLGLLHWIWVGPLEMIIIMYLMYQYVQESAVMGVMTLLMFIAVQGFLARKSSSYRKKVALKTDERVNLTNEILNGIQAIKMYTWENHFVELVSSARSEDINFIRKMSHNVGVIESLFSFSTRLTLFMTLLSFVLLGNKINAEIVFAITAYYHILRTSMTSLFPLGMNQLAELLVSISRIQKFMMYEEVSTRTNLNFVSCKHKDSNIERNLISFDEDIKDGHIRLKNATAKWFPDNENDTLRDVDIDIKPGELIVIVGQVGAGKSSLLNVILKELSLASGSIWITGRIAYASQEPWLFSGSIRQNILFGREMNQHKYEEVIEVCQLKRDFNLLPYGDQTIIGNRGIRLSGGQRARINLARAVYSDVPIYVFDDPLSAVDTKVGKQIFEKCICKYLKHKTRILVTHQMQYLSSVDRIIVLKNGFIQTQGTLNQLVQNGVDYSGFLKSNVGITNSSQHVSKRNTSGQNGPNFLNLTIENKISDENFKEIEEICKSGSVSGLVYKAYLKNAGGWYNFIYVFILFVLSQFLTSAGDYFVFEWTKIEENSKIYENGTYESAVGWKDSLTRYDWIYIYTAITASTVIVTFIRSAAFFNACMRASHQLHDRMLNSVIRALMLFFNNNSTGKILNRFSKDLGQVDELLPVTLMDVLQYGFSLIGIIAVVTVLNPWLIAPTVIICPIFWWLRVIYIRTSRSVKRLEGVTRSPVFTHLSASLEGLSIIRAFDADETLINEFDRHQDLHSSAWFNFLSTTRAFGFYLDFSCVIYIAFVMASFFFGWSEDQGNDKPSGGSVGLAITQSIALTHVFQWAIRQSTELENHMTSVERILEFSDLLSEPPLESSSEKKPKHDWPDQGKIEFKNVFLRYSPSESPVIKNLDFLIQPKEKIGIVGRTGAGKSSLIQSLIRLADIQGVIKIDGIDIKDISLHELRRHISIIPQEPFLFSGDLRNNLDPFNKKTDFALRCALEEVELNEMELDDPVSEDGSNMSVGQRQLVCLARAIVQNNPILILDEATANVDPKTDELIQKTIRTKFKNCTVLTIAHRLNTVMDSDRILVMDAGTNVEFDHPYTLLQKESGFFRSMVNETGPEMSETLIRIAENSFKTS